MELHQQPANADAEISLIDLLVTLADNAKLLIFGPLAVGLVALAITFVLPERFESVAILQAEPVTASLIVTAAVLDPAAASLGLAQNHSIEDAREALRARIKTASGRTDKLLTITVSGATPSQAQDAAKAVLEATYAQSRPTGATKARLEAQLLDSKNRLESAQIAGNTVRAIFDNTYVAAKVLKAGVADLPRDYAELLNAISVAQAQVLLVEAQLEGLTDSQLVQPLTLPEKAVSPKKGLITVGATLASGFLLLLFVFVRNSLRRAEADPASAAKLARIRRALSFQAKTKPA